MDLRARLVVRTQFNVLRRHLKMRGPELSLGDLDLLAGAPHIAIKGSK